ncbi:MAG TPA: hypothetical protein VFC56_10010 [Stellaceae bacterium]|nr:hypothetical protein [Stellaceae bacterium]
MVGSSTADGWPIYLPGPRDDIFAIGVVALTYGLLENILRVLFSCVADLNDFQALAIFERMSNAGRLDSLKDILKKTTISKPLKERVLHFCSAFDICAENRHGIMHSHSGGIYTRANIEERGILITKYTRKGNKLVCAISLQELRNIADSMNCYASYGALLSSDIGIFKRLQARGKSADFERMPLPGIPPLPDALNWKSPKEILAEQSRPQSSPE